MFPLSHVRAITVRARGCKRKEVEKSPICQPRPAIAWNSCCESIACHYASPPWLSGERWRRKELYINKIVNMPKIDRIGGKLYNGKMLRRESKLMSGSRAELNECAVSVLFCAVSLSIAESMTRIGKNRPETGEHTKRDGKTIFIKSHVIRKWRIFAVEMKNISSLARSSRSASQFFSRPIKGRFRCVNIVMNLQFLNRWIWLLSSRRTICQGEFLECNWIFLSSTKCAIR